jgi:hypothetical protein
MKPTANLRESFQAVFAERAGLRNEANSADLAIL